MKTSRKPTFGVRRALSILLFGSTIVAACICGLTGGAFAQSTAGKDANTTDGARFGTQSVPAASPPVVSCTAPSGGCSSSITGPCSITSGGSYTLTANVSQSSATIDGIEIKVPHVTLNLNGYRVVGPGSGLCAGINACQSGTCNSDITVTEGTVTQFGGPGVQLGASGNGVAHSARDIKSHHNGEGSGGGGGILLGDYSMAANDITYCNGWEDATCSGSGTGDGIDCGAHCLVIGNLATSNAGDGIIGGNYNNVIFNSADSNQTGIAPGSSSGYCNNVAQGNSVAAYNGGTVTCTNN